MADIAHRIRSVRRNAGNFRTAASFGKRAKVDHSRHPRCKFPEGPAHGCEPARALPGQRPMGRGQEKWTGGPPNLPARNIGALGTFRYGTLDNIPRAPLPIGIATFLEDSSISVKLLPMGDFGKQTPGRALMSLPFVVREVAFQTTAPFQVPLRGASLSKRTL